MLIPLLKFRDLQASLAAIDRARAAEIRENSALVHAAFEELKTARRERLIDIAVRKCLPGSRFFYRNYPVEFSKHIPPGSAIGGPDGLVPSAALVDRIRAEFALLVQGGSR